MTMILDGTNGITLPSGAVTNTSGAIVGTSDTQTLTNKTLTSPTISTPTMTGQATIPTINLTGGQIAFPATASISSNANTLDDYEEGTWTPAITGGTLTVNIATYTKIGDRFFMIMDVNITSVSAGNITITGVPFSTSGMSISAIGGDQFDFSTALIMGHAYASGTSINFYYFTSGSNGIIFTNSNIRNGTCIRTAHQCKTTS